jgi:hypothetical protein
VSTTLVFAVALSGSISTIVNCGVGENAIVPVAVGNGVKVVVGEAGVTGVQVAVGMKVKVGEGETVGRGVKVKVGDGTGEAGVTPGGRVGEGGADGVGVMIAGLPNSLHPRSGAVPENPRRGIGGTDSPLDARN